jgi:hypothetical protein
MPISRILASLILFLSLTGCPAQDDVGRTDDGWLVRGQEEARDTTQRSVRLGERRLVIEIAHGSVTLTGADVAEAQLRFERVARAGSRRAAETRLQEIEIEEVGDVGHYEFQVPPDRARATQVHVVGTVPRGAHVVVRTDRGDVRLSRLGGEINVRVQTGRIEAAGLTSAQVDLRNERGRQEIGFAAVPPRADIRLRSGNGNIDVVLPPDASVQVVAETSLGSIAIDGLGLARERFEERRAETRYRGRLGDGQARLVAQTSLGNIRLEGGASHTLDDREPAAGVEGAAHDS